jgi:hypothetical protein
MEMHIIQNHLSLLEEATKVGMEVTEEEDMMRCVMIRTFFLVF